MIRSRVLPRVGLPLGGQRAPGTSAADRHQPECVRFCLLPRDSGPAPGTSADAPPPPPGCRDPRPHPDSLIWGLSPGETPLFLSSTPPRGRSSLALPCSHFILRCFACGEGDRPSSGVRGLLVVWMDIYGGCCADQRRKYIYIHTHTHTHTHIYIYIYIYTYTCMEEGCFSLP